MNHISQHSTALGWGYNNTTFQKHKQAKHNGLKFIQK